MTRDCNRSRVSGHQVRNTDVKLSDLFTAWITVYTHQHDEFKTQESHINSSTKIHQESATHLLTPWSRVLLQKLTSSQLVKKFSAFYRTLKFITTFTSAHHLSLFWAISIQYMPHPTSLRSILILSSHLSLGLTSCFFLSSFPTKTLYAHLLSPVCATCSTHLILLYSFTQLVFGEEYRSLSSPLCSLHHFPVTSSPQYTPQHSIFQLPSA